MSPVDAFWHLANLFSPALGLALIAPSLAKLLWRHDLRRVGWSGLVLWTWLASAMVIVVGLLLLGRDGLMASYAAMVLAAAAVLWWRGWCSV
jgi:hypothetical protein